MANCKNVNRPHMMITDIVINCIGSTPSSFSELEPTYEQTGKSQGGLTPEYYVS